MFRPFISELAHRLKPLLAPDGHLLLCYEINEAAGMIHVYLLTEGEAARWQTANRPAPRLSATVTTGQAVVYPADTAVSVHAKFLALLISE